MKVINTGEETPEYFYVFQQFSNNVTGQINRWNFKLSKKIISSGFSNIELDRRKLKDFLDGNIDYLPFVKAETSTNSPSSFIMNLINEYNIEHNLEVCRKSNYKLFPSRLSGIFAFGDYETCKLVSQKYGWDLSEVKKFKLLDVKDLNFAVKVGKFNMAIVSLLRGIDIMRFPVQDQENLYKKYWLGDSNATVQIQNFETGEWQVINSDTIYEYIIEGILEEVEQNGKIC